MSAPTLDAPHSFVDFFRLSAPYIHAHRGRTFVIMFGGEAVIDHDFPHLVHDVALLHALGVRLVLVHGSRPQIEKRLRDRKIKPRFSEGTRITDRPTMSCVEDAVGNIRGRIEGLLSRVTTRMASRATSSTSSPRWAVAKGASSSPATSTPFPSMRVAGRPIPSCSPTWATIWWAWAWRT